LQILRDGLAAIATEAIADDAARDPVAPVEHAEPQLLGERAAVGIVDGKRLVAHPEDQEGLLPPCPAPSLQHRDAIEDVSGTHHQRHHHSTQRMEGRDEHRQRQELHRTAVDHHRHQHRHPQRQPHLRGQQSVGHTEKHVGAATAGRLSSVRPISSLYTILAAKVLIFSETGNHIDMVFSPLFLLLKTQI